MSGSNAYYRVYSSGYHGLRLCGYAELFDDMFEFEDTVAEEIDDLVWEM